MSNAKDEGSGLSGADRYIADATKAKVTEALEVNRTKAQKYQDGASADVMDWLKKLGYVK